jgi:hypothetical protein
MLTGSQGHDPPPLVIPLPSSASSSSLLEANRCQISHSLVKFEVKKKKNKSKIKNNKGKALSSI